jgi:hypothetical protein
MNLGKLIPKMKHEYAKDVHNNYRFKSPEKGMETALGVFDNSQNLFSINTPTYYIGLIKLFDRAITETNLHMLSIDQQALLERYFEQANTLTRKHTSALEQDYIEPELTSEEYVHNWELLDRDIQKLDKFLGSYYGKDVGIFLPYTTKENKYNCRKVTLVKSEVYTKEQ